MELVIESFMAARPKPMNGHVTYFHYFVSVVVRELFTFKSSFPEPQGTTQTSDIHGNCHMVMSAECPSGDVCKNVHLVMSGRMFTW
jgi:hypothetical protein